jgi:hypothetical protein
VRSFIAHNDHPRQAAISAPSKDSSDSKIWPDLGQGSSGALARQVGFANLACSGEAVISAPTCGKAAISAPSKDSSDSKIWPDLGQGSSGALARQAGLKHWLAFSQSRSGALAQARAEVAL